MFPQFMIQKIHNYEVHKLVVESPDYVNIGIVTVFVLAAILTSRKSICAQVDEVLLSPQHTDQLKGLAIFFVVLGHFWIHVSSHPARIVLSGDAVALFLLLSGFGLMISCQNKSITFKEFFEKRVRRVMVPYWLVTVLILFLDYVILGRSLQGKEMLMTFLGLNFSVELCHIDFVRWFVTFILLWYLIFYSWTKLQYNNISSVSFLVFGIFLFLLDYYLLKIGWYQFFAFPVGCLLGTYRSAITNYYKMHESEFIFMSIISILYVIFNKIVMSDISAYSVISKLIPNIIISFHNEIVSLLFCFFLTIILFVGISLGYCSNLLLFLGKYSYEIFLLHGVFLIKYNPVIMSIDPHVVIVQFCIYFLMICCVAVPVNSLQRFVYVGIKK